MRMRLYNEDGISKKPVEVCLNATDSEVINIQFDTEAIKAFLASFEKLDLVGDACDGTITIAEGLKKLVGKPGKPEKRPLREIKLTRDFQDELDKV